MQFQVEIGSNNSCFKKWLDSDVWMKLFPLSFQTHSQYVLASHQLFPQGGHCATMAPSSTSTSLLTQPLMSSHNQGKGTRAHITLNPYSTQLVESINLMMPEKSSASSSATNSSSSTTSTTLGRTNSKQTCSMTINPHLINLTNSLRRGMENTFSKLSLYN